MKRILAPVAYLLYGGTMAFLSWWHAPQEAMHVGIVNIMDIMPLPLDLVVALGGGFGSYWVFRMADRDRMHRENSELRKWIEDKFVSREVLDSKLENLGTRILNLETTQARHHAENTSKLDSILSIMAQTMRMRGE